jgi:hypothetical protein
MALLGYFGYKLPFAPSSELDAASQIVEAGAHAAKKIKETKDKIVGAATGQASTRAERSQGGDAIDDILEGGKARAKEIAGKTPSTSKPTPPPKSSTDDSDDYLQGVVYEELFGEAPAPRTASRPNDRSSTIPIPPPVQPTKQPAKTPTQPPKKKPSEFEDFNPYR